MSDGSMNLTVQRGDKSVWDSRGIAGTLSDYDQERWMAAAWGSALTVLGARRGGFGGGLLAVLGSTIAVRAAMGRRDLHVARHWIDERLVERRLARQGHRPRELGGIVPGQRRAVLDGRLRRTINR